MFGELSELSASGLKRKAKSYTGYIKDESGNAVAKRE